MERAAVTWLAQGDTSGIWGGDKTLFLLPVTHAFFYSLARSWCLEGSLKASALETNKLLRPVSWYQGVELDATFLSAAVAAGGGDGKNSGHSYASFS